MHQTKAPALARHAAPLTLAASTPHTVIDVLGESVFEALRRHETGLTDALSGQHPETVAGKENLRRVVPALTVRHPFGPHFVLLCRPLPHSTESWAVVIDMSRHAFSANDRKGPKIWVCVDR